MDLHVSMSSFENSVEFLTFRSLGDCGYAGYLAHKEQQSAKSPSQDMNLKDKVELRKKEVDGNNAIKWDSPQVSAPTHVGLVVARRAVFQSIAR